MLVGTRIRGAKNIWFKYASTNLFIQAIAPEHLKVTDAGPVWKKYKKDHDVLTFAKLLTKT